MCEHWLQNHARAHTHHLLCAGGRSVVPLCHGAKPALDALSLRHELSHLPEVVGKPGEVGLVRHQFERDTMVVGVCWCRQTFHTLAGAERDHARQKAHTRKSDRIECKTTCLLSSLRHRRRAMEWPSKRPKTEMSTTEKASMSTGWSLPANRGPALAADPDDALQLPNVSLAATGATGACTVAVAYIVSSFQESGSDNKGGACTVAVAYIVSSFQESENDEKGRSARAGTAIAGSKAEKRGESGHSFVHTCSSPGFCLFVAVSDLLRRSALDICSAAA